MNKHVVFFVVGLSNKVVLFSTINKVNGPFRRSISFLTYSENSDRKVHATR